MTARLSSSRVITALTEVNKNVSVSDALKRHEISDDALLQWGGFSIQQLENALSQQSIKTIIESDYDTVTSDNEPDYKPKTRIQRMLKKNLENTVIKYSFFSDSRFGPGLVASTEFGICYLGFYSRDSADAKDKLLSELTRRYCGASSFQEEVTKHHSQAIFCLENDEPNEDMSQSFNLHIMGTDFQFAVWKALLSIPRRQLSTYSKIAISIENGHALRAVGSAVGKNPVSYFIPCHRVVNSNGKIGHYMWGSNVKMAMIGWEILS